MKFLTLLAAAALAASVGACTTTSSTRHVATVQPSIRLEAPRKAIMVGESTRVVAHTVDVVGAGPVKWTVSPNVAKISQESDTGQTAIFSADQPGRYIINAAVQRKDGTWVTSSDTFIDVAGRMTTDR